MSQEPELVSPDEFVLRRIHKNQVEVGPPRSVNFTGFRPTPQDTAGLSLYREKYASAAEVAASGRKAGAYFVVRLPVRFLLDLGLSVVADEQAGGPAGHVLVPELSLAACKRDKTHTREIQVRLAEMASHSVVHPPDEKPVA